jgi:molybdopterin converting factor subunit 1
VGTYSMSDKETLTILLFASLRDAVGKPKINVEFTGDLTVSKLKEILIAQYPQLDLYTKKIVVAVNRNFAMDKDLIPRNAEIALFPPVSGGSAFSTVIRIIEDPIIVADWITEITYEQTGGISIFLGVVRGQTENLPIIRTDVLEYQVYHRMAEEMLEKIAGEIRKKWPKVQGVVIIQRTGKLRQGIPSVLIACSASHRNDGIFDATKYAIERLKEIVPIWKKEIGPDGEAWIEGGFVPGKGGEN